MFAVPCWKVNIFQGLLSIYLPINFDLHHRCLRTESLQHDAPTTIIHHMDNVSFFHHMVLGC